MEAKVQIRPIQFSEQEGATPKDYLGHEYSLIQQINYYEAAEEYIFMFWPQLTDEVEKILCSVANVTYNPTIYPHIYRALRSEPHLFKKMHIAN